MFRLIRRTIFFNPNLSLIFRNYYHAKAIFSASSSLLRFFFRFSCDRQVFAILCRFSVNLTCCQPVRSCRLEAKHFAPLSVVVRRAPSDAPSDFRNLPGGEHARARLPITKELQERVQRGLGRSQRRRVEVCNRIVNSETGRSETWPLTPAGEETNGTHRMGIPTVQKVHDRKKKSEE